MITPFLLVKERLADLFGETNEARVWLGIRESLKMLDDAIDQQEAEDRAHRDEVEALMGMEPDPPGGFGPNIDEWE